MSEPYVVLLGQCVWSWQEKMCPEQILYPLFMEFQPIY
jgi:hypothetical protein